MDTADSEVTRKKRLLVSEIRRTAEANHGIPLGQINFSKATGIKISDWRGKLWLRWNEALQEAGYPPNKKQGPFDEELLIDNFIGLMRELGHFPISTELEKKRYQNRSFPCHMAFRARWGSQRQQAERIALYCQSHKGQDDILAMCEPIFKSQRLPAHSPMQTQQATGFICLVKKRRKWGTYYLKDARTPRRTVNLFKKQSVASVT